MPSSCGLQHFILDGMLMKNVKIEIDSIVEDLDDAGLVDNSDKTHTIADGKMIFEGDSIRISYSETNENVTTSSDIIIKGSEVSVKRSGAVEYEFRFIEGKSTKSLYSVPPYSFDTEIYTRKIRKDFNGPSGKLSLIYDMTIGGAKKKTRMNIYVSGK